MKSSYNAKDTPYQRQRADRRAPDAAEPMANQG